MGEFELQYSENKGFRHPIGRRGAAITLQNFPQLRQKWHRIQDASKRGVR